MNCRNLLSRMHSSVCHSECNEESKPTMLRFFAALKMIVLFFCFLVFLFTAPHFAHATGVGFVPSTGIWFSRDTFYPKETIRIYTVIINNDYYSLDGTVAFYDNRVEIDRVDVKGLAKESVKQIRVFWEPTEGEHAVSAQFIKAVATDEKGNKQTLDIQTINSVAGAPLKMGTSTITPTPIIITTSSATTLGSTTIKIVPLNANTVTTSAVLLGSQTEVVVRKEGDKLVLEPAPETNTSGFGAHISEGNSGDTGGDLFAKNREILDKVEQVAGTITTTADKINKAYAGTQEVFEKGKGYWAGAKEQWGKAAPYLQKVVPAWKAVSHNNDPRYIAGIVGGVVGLYWILRWKWRKKKIRNFGED